MKKRLLALLLLILLFATVACNVNDPNASTTTQGSEAENTPSETTAPPDPSNTTESEETTAPINPDNTTVTSITFSAFSDFHYQEGKFVAGIEDLEAILKRANDNGAQFVIQAGDFSNDFKGSPELINAYFNNAYGLPVYGIFGNHELESGNSMGYVTQRLTNRKDNVIWGTSSGKIEAGKIGYYYFDTNGFRIICLDTNYSWNPTKEQWEHNPTGSYVTPSGNTKGESLGPEQLAWLEKVLNDAVTNELHCIVFAHSGFSNSWSSSPDASAVRALYKSANTRRSGTVMLSVNGHLHQNNISSAGDGVVYLSLNAAINGHYSANGEHHYTTSTYPLQQYDSEGNKIGEVREVPVSSLAQSMAKVNWFFESPISAIITVSSDGTIDIKGEETTWIDGIRPPTTNSHVVPRISSGTYRVEVAK